MTDQVLVLRGVWRSQGRRTFLSFLDVSKPHDTVWKEGL